MTGPYDDIIHLPHHTSRTRPRMPINNRAAQFSPFAALTGHDAAINETARLTDKRIELDDAGKALLDWRLGMVLDRLDERPEVSVTYFLPDEKKAGRSYVTAEGFIKKFDRWEGALIMRDGVKIPVDEIISMESEMFDLLD